MKTIFLAIALAVVSSGSWIAWGVCVGQSELAERRIDKALLKERSIIYVTMSSAAALAFTGVLCGEYKKRVSQQAGIPGDDDQH